MTTLSQYHEIVNWVFYNNMNSDFKRLSPDLIMEKIRDEEGNCIGRGLYYYRNIRPEEKQPVILVYHDGTMVFDRNNYGWYVSTYARNGLREKIEELYNHVGALDPEQTHLIFYKRKSTVKYRKTDTQGFARYLLTKGGVCVQDQ
jgi:hypothetical protein